MPTHFLGQTPGRCHRERRPVSSMKGRLVSRGWLMVVDLRVAVGCGEAGSPWLIGVLGRCPGLVALVAGRAWPGQAPCVAGVGDRRRLWALDAGGRVWQGLACWSWCSGGWAPVRWRRSGLGGGSSHPSGRAGRTRVSCGARGLNQPHGRPCRCREGGQTQERARPSMHLAPLCARVWCELVLVMRPRPALGCCGRRWQSGA